jgi:prepilin-type processing-associated H-X9-DG protein
MPSAILSINTGCEYASEHRPQEVMLDGLLFLFAEQSVQPCVVTHLSPGKAIVRCDEAPPLSSAVLLYVEGFGRLHAVTRAFADGHVEMHLDPREAAKKRLKTQLAVFQDGGLIEVTRTRTHSRVAMAVKSQFIRADGSIVPCVISDFSLAGMFLKTDARPQIGEYIIIDDHMGTVVRHGDDGIGIAFEKARDAS